MELEPTSKDKNEFVPIGLMDIKMMIPSKRGKLDSIHQLLNGKKYG
jgi:hypothetical protein